MPSLIKRENRMEALKEMTLEEKEMALQSIKEMPDSRARQIKLYPYRVLNPIQLLWELLVIGISKYWF